MATIEFYRLGNTVFASYVINYDEIGRTEHDVICIWYDEENPFTARKQANFIKKYNRQLCGNVEFKNLIF